MAVDSEQHFKCASRMAGRTRARLWIAVLMWGAIAINYIDRANLSAAAPSIMKDFHLTSGEMGIVMSAFFWSYMLFQIPSGWLADRIGYRVSLSLAVGWWSVATALTATARGVTSLVGLRVLLGIGESGAYPRACCHFTQRRVVTQNCVSQGTGRRPWSFQGPVL